MTDDALRPLKKRKFIEAFRAHGVVAPACRAAGIVRNTYWKWKQEDPEFSREVDHAKQDAIDAGELELRRRGVEGWREPILHGGEPVWLRDPNTGEILLDENFDPVPFTVPKHSDRLLEVYTRAHRPEYKERTEVAVTGHDGGALAAPVVKYVLPDGRSADDYDHLADAEPPAPVPNANSDSDAWLD